MYIYIYIYIYILLYIYKYIYIDIDIDIYIYICTQQSLDPILYILKSARCLPYSGSSCFNDSS